MEILRSAFRHGIDSEDIHHALRNSLVVDEIGEDPTRYLVLGPNRAGGLLELVVLDRPQGPAVIHANGHATEVPAATTEGRQTVTTNHGYTEDGSPITDETIEELADEAERGYDPDDIVRRRGGRPAMGSAAASVESVRLDPDTKRALLLRAANDGISMSETIRRAVDQYLKVS